MPWSGKTRSPWTSRAARGAAYVLAVVGMVAGVAYLTTGSSMWSRMMLWGDADVGDMERFPLRVIANSPGDLWQFHQPANRSVYDSLWAPLTVKRSDGEQIIALDELLEQNGTGAFLVLRGDTLLMERYYNGATAESVFPSFSAAKSLLSLLVGIAVHEGHIPGVMSPIVDAVPELERRDPRFAAITLQHLMTMSSGLAYERRPQWGDPGRTYYGPDLREVAMTPRWAADPGTLFLYNNYNPLLVGLILERTTGQSVSAYFEQHIWRRIGAAGPASWNLDSEHSGFEKMESGFNARAEDFARLGLLMLQHGQRDSLQIIPRTFVDQATRVDSLNDPSARYQYFWWTTSATARPPYWAEGRFGQFIWVSPADSLVIIRLGAHDGDMRWPSLFTQIASRLPQQRP